MSTSVLGSIVNNVVDTITGETTGSTLNDFLTKFGSSDRKYVDTIDPIATFETYIKFYPTQGQESKSDWKQALLNSAGKALTNAANNITGGLLGSLMNNTSISQAHDSFSHSQQCSFMEYLAKANLLVGSDNWLNSQQSTCPLELQLSFYVQSITVPMIRMPDDGKSQTLLGEFPINGHYVIPDNNIITMSIINTKLPLHERIFYPWMREVTLPYWSYQSQPYTTATITIDFSKHMDIQYNFYGCRPQQIDTIQPTQDPTSGAITRNVSFIFDFMTITSKKSETIESVSSKLLSTGKTLVNSAANMLNI